MKITLSRFAATTMLLAVSIMSATVQGNAQDNKCANTITTCGCTITLPGKYEVATEIYGFQGLTLKNDCIDINTSKVTLTVNGAIVGPNVNSCPNTGSPLTRGAAQLRTKEAWPSALQRILSQKPDDNQGNLVGIHVLAGVSNVTINFGGEDVCGWTYGVESEGSKVSINEVGAYDNQVGVMLNNATANTCLYCDAEYNMTGVEVYYGSGNSFTDGSGDNNYQYGYWLFNTTGNKFTDNFANYNSIAGFYLGCSPIGQFDTSERCHTNSNTVLDNNAGDNGDMPYTPGYGIAVEWGGVYNVVKGNTTADQAFGLWNQTIDIVDGTGNCIYNTYKQNTYLTKQPNCIH